MNEYKQRIAGGLGREGDSVVEETCGKDRYDENAEAEFHDGPDGGR